MISRLGTVVSFGLLITVIVFGRDFASYLITSADVVSDSVREQIPVAFELDRARHMIEALAPQIKKDRYAIAREQVELENLQSRIDELVESQTLEKRSLERLQKRLESQTKSRRRANGVSRTEPIARIAETRFSTYKTQEATLENLRRTYDARREAVESKQSNLELLVAAKHQLSAEVECLEARQRLTQVAGQQNDIHDDDSQLMRTRELIQDVETRVRIAERMAVTNHQVSDGVFNIDDRTSKHISERIGQYFADANSRGLGVEAVATKTGDLSATN